MADLIEIPVKADTREVDNLVASLGKASNAANLAAKNIRDMEKLLKAGVGADKLLTAFSRLEKAGMSLSNVNKGLAQDQQMLGKSYQDYYNTLLKVDQGNKSAKASFEILVRETERSAASFLKLRNSIDPVFRSQQQLLQTKKTIRAQLQQNNITMEQAVDMMRKYRAAQVEMGSSMAAGTKAANRLGVATQSIGYQVGDFLVQVQSGANWMMAFGQQATQLVGVLSLWGGKMIALSAALGILIPLVTAVGAYFLRSSQEAKKSASDVETFDDKLKNLNQTLKDWTNTKRAAESGISVELLAGTDALAEAQAKVDGLRKAMELAEQAAKNMVGAQAEAARGKYVENMKAAVENLTAAEEVLAQLRAKEREEREKSFAGEKRNLEQQIAMGRMIVQFGEDSLAVKRLENQQAQDNYREELRKKNLTEDQINLLVTMLSNQQAISGEINRSAAEASLLAQNLRAAAGAIAAVMSATASMNISAIGLEAQNKALEKGNSLIKARAEGMIAAKRAELSDAFGSGDAAIRAGAALELENYTQAVERNSQAQALNEKLIKANTASTKSSSKARSGGAKAAKKAAKEAEKLADEIERLEFDADPLKKYNSELEHLNKLARNGLSDGAYAKAVADLNDEFANSDPMISKAGDAIADFVAGGMRDFDSLLDAFKNMLKQMIATAIANPIKLAITSAMGGSVPATAQAGSIPGVSSGLSGMAGTFMGGLGAGGTGLIGGAANVISSFGMSGFGGAMSSIGTSLAGATSSLAGFGAAVGAIALPIAAVTAVFSFFSKKVKELDSGIRITAEGTDLAVKGFKKLETSRFWGLSKKVSMEFEDLEPEVAGPLTKTLSTIQNNVMSMADTLGFAASVFDDFTIEIDAATKGLSEAEANAKLEEVIGNFANNFANMIPELDAFTSEGMNMYEVLQMIVTNLTGVNAAFDQLGFNLLEMSLEGAKASEAFIAIFGSLENFNAAASTYYQRFYSDAERVAKSTDNMRSALTELGLVMPSTIEGFRRLVEQAEAVGDLDRVGKLIGMSGAFADIVDGQKALEDKAAQDLQAAFSREMEKTRERFAEIISALQDKLTSAREKLAQSQAIYDALRQASRARIFPSADAERIAVDQAAAYLRSLRGSDITDLDALQEALSAVADPSTDTYKTLVDYQRDFLRTSAVIADLEKTAGHTLSADEEAVKVLEEQLAQAEEALEKELELLQEQLDTLLNIDESIQSLADAIQAFLASQVTQVNPTGGIVHAGGPLNNDGVLDTTTAFGASPGSAAAIADGNNSRKIYQLYQDILGRAPDQAGLQFYVEAARKDTSINQIAEYLRQSDEANSYAVGTSFHPGGMAMVHQDELINLPRGASVTPASKVKEMGMRSNSGNGELVAEVRSLRSEVAGLRAESAQLQAANNKFTKRSYDLSRKWDIEGLPAERAA